MGKRVDSLMVERQANQPEDDGSNPISTLHFIEIDVHTAVALNAKWHSVVPFIKWTNVVRNKKYCCFGGYCGGNPVAVAIWSSPVAANRLKQGHDLLELRRYAISSEAPRHTASRGLAIMTRLIKKKFPNIIALISYQDEVAHKGTIYRAAGWINEGVNYKGPAGQWGAVRDQSVYERRAAQSSARKIRWRKLLTYD